jgi:acyl-CoA synthetase (AMP-forming)/AMP-acid ligase II
VYITGRLKDIIIRNAENISALDVEEALTRHPRILEAAVFGVDDPAVGERVAAAVVTTDGKPISRAELDSTASRSDSPDRRARTRPAV